MLSSDELKGLAGAICATAETLGYTLSASAAVLMAEDLADYPAQDIRGALQACRRELTGKLTLAAILQRVNAADGRPEPNEAWAIALGATDESDSMMLTEEIQLAMGAASAVLEAGDNVGGRMAFLSAYARFVDTARRAATPACWTLSLGTDPQRRVVAVEAAVRLGRIGADRGQQLVAQISHSPVTRDGAAIAGLITGKGPVPTEEIREKLQVMRDDLTALRGVSDKQRAQIKRDHAGAHAARVEKHLNLIADMQAAELEKGITR